MGCVIFLCNYTKLKKKAPNRLTKKELHIKIYYDYSKKYNYETR